MKKKKFEGYPLHVEYSLTKKRGQHILKALKILQEIGVDYMLEHGMEQELICKGILPQDYKTCNVTARTMSDQQP